MNMTYEWSPSTESQARAAPKVTHVLYSYDGPKIVLAIDTYECQSLGVAVDDDDEEQTTRWMFVSVSPEEVLELLQGSRSLWSLFVESSHIDIWDLDRHWVARRSFVTMCDDVPPRLLPEAGAFLPELTRDVYSRVVDSQHNMMISEGMHARADLYFDGGPVRGKAILASFAGKALSAYQELVSVMHGTRQRGEVRQTGPIPARSESLLYISSMPMGSVGFELVERIEQHRFDQSELSYAMTDVHNLLSAASGSDERYADTMRASEMRMGKFLGEFLGIIKGAGATLRIKSRKRRYEFSALAIERAMERVSHVTYDDELRAVRGVLDGILPAGLRFELVAEQDGRTISGQISKTADITKVSTFYKRPCTAALLVVRGPRKESFVLLDVAPP